MDPIYLLSFRLPETAAGLAEIALEPLGGALALGLPDSRGEVELKLYLGEDPGRPNVASLMAAVALAAEVPAPEFSLELLPEIDWVAESQAALPPIAAGRFWVYGSHVEARPPAASIPLLIDANLAFGTGRHETTRGCLLALQDLARRVMVRRALDLGCGSGILALGIARLWRKSKVLGADMDSAPIKVACHNARINEERARTSFLTSRGYDNAAIRRAGPYDLIVANILAGPLCDLATETSTQLLPGGRVVLSGLLDRQERQVLARYRAVGLAFERRWRIGEWSTLVLRR